MPHGSHKVLSSIERCHTAAMGYHAYTCDDATCEHIHIQYHGCRNRHCPHCGSLRAQHWMEDRLRELLPVKYFHACPVAKRLGIVFTLPSELKAIAYLNRKVIYNLLFQSSSHCLLTLSKDEKWLGGVPSISAVLHSWATLEIELSFQTIFQISPAHSCFQIFFSGDCIKFIERYLVIDYFPWHFPFSVI